VTLGQHIEERLDWDPDGNGEKIPGALDSEVEGDLKQSQKP
jgi:hypothetical protein